MFSLKTSTAKSLLLGTVLASALIAPLPATAQNTYVMVVNMRSTDGVYRPAIRVVRNGQVFFYRTDDVEAENPLTVAILRNKAQLMTWLMENAGLTSAEADSIVIEEPYSRPKTKGDVDETGGEEEPSGGEDPDDECSCGYQCGEDFFCWDKDIGMNDALLESLQFANLTVADLDEAQRMSAYATL